MTAQFLLAFAALTLVATVAVQDWLVPVLRHETISAGLTGPYHVALDAAYVLLAAALIAGFRGHKLLDLIATVSAICLFLTAVTNTFGTWVDTFTGGKHSLWHSRFTTAVFVSALALEIFGSFGVLWAVLGLGLAAPGAAYWFTKRVDLIEKLAVLGIACWLVGWAISARA